jgi:hypothetical protein
VNEVHMGRMKCLRQAQETTLDQDRSSSLLQTVHSAAFFEGIGRYSSACAGQFLIASLSIDARRHEDPTFGIRQSNGVSLKLSNFVAAANPGHGMEAISRWDRQVFHEFSAEPERLGHLANAIEEAAKAPMPPPGMTLISKVNMRRSECCTASTGRGTVIVNSRTGEARGASRRGSLQSEACDFEFESRYGTLVRGFIECHTVPVSTMKPGDATSLKDLALVCASCHHILHRSTTWWRRHRLAADPHC